ncbi:MAG: toll/interleukin-1 receptor domain-containing protein, partial [Prevotella sp.]|nr:toll/interleukin-1 receptor domain-containing protein [Prevotella sp.]
MIIKKDFFISYTHDDEQWAKWIAETLNDADYSTIIQAWDLKPGTDFVAQIQKALYFVDRFIPVVSKTYLSQTGWAQREWTSIFANAHSSEKNLFIPVCVEQLNAGIDNWGLFSTISTISLFNKSEEELNKELLNGISTNGRSKNTPAIPDTNKKPLFANDMPFNNLPARNTRFTGRTKQLKAISQGFKNRNTILLTQTVKDLDGIGKSEIAKEYAFRKGYEYECIWWINAETDATIQSAYTEFALKKGLVNPDTKEIEIFIEAVKYWMSRHNYWLFIFDNAEDKKLLQKYLP